MQLKVLQVYFPAYAHITTLMSTVPTLNRLSYVFYTKWLPSKNLIEMFVLVADSPFSTENFVSPVKMTVRLSITCLTKALLVLLLSLDGRPTPLESW